MASIGYNVTTLSADFDADSVPNLHPIHLENIYTEFYDETLSDFDFIEYGNAPAWKQMKEMYDYSLVLCKVSIKSNGWKQLQNYPSDFKVPIIKKFI